jgi:hypothetical protein
MTNDRRSRNDLEEALRALAPTIEVPPTPDYAERVTRQLADEANRSRSRSRISRSWIAASHRMRRFVVAAALVLIAMAVTVAVPGTRHALASWLGFKGIEIRTAPSRASTAAVTPAPLAAGPQVTVQQAQRAATNRIALPANLQPPDRTFLRRDGAALVVTLAYRRASTLKPTPDTGYALIVTEIFDAGDPVLEKLLHTGATTTSVHIRGRPGVFIEGPQEIINIDHSRTNHGMDVVHEVDPRASANTLIWSDSNGTYRLEGDFTRQTALDLAGSFR